MRRPNSFGWILLVATAALANVGRAEAQDLRYKFEEGQELLFNMKQNIDISLTAEGAEDQKSSFKQAIEQVTEILWTVDEVRDDGTAKISQKVQRIKMNLKATPNVEFQYDSASDEEPTGSIAANLTPILGALVGATFDVTMNSRGEIVEIQVPDDVVQALQKVPNAAQMGGMFSKEGLEKMVQQGSLTFPEGQIEPGREWTNSFEVESPGRGTQTVTTKYRYLGQEEVDGQTLDAFAVSLQLDLGEDAAPAGTEVTVQKQESDGKIYFDREEGRMKSSRIDMNMDTEIEAFNQTMTSQMKQHVEVEVTEP